MIIPYLLLFLLPTQLALHFWPSWAFVYGIRVDYLAPAIYLTDILALALVFTNVSIYRKYMKYLSAILIFATINTFFSTSPPESIYKWLKVFEMILVGLYFVNSKIETQKVIKTLFYSAIFFSLIGIWQFFLGKSLGGVLYYLGERSFTTQTPEIALATIFGRVFLRAYSTFSHPNSLAGFLGVILILLLDFKRKKPLFFIRLIVVVMGFILSFSLTAFLAILLVLVLKYTVKRRDPVRKVSFGIFYATIFISLLLPIFSKKLLSLSQGFGQSITQRLDFSFLAGKMVGERFFIGEGLNTFIMNIPRFKGILSYSWILQPVHNVPLLIYSETGVIGLIILFVLFHKVIGNAFKLGNRTLALAVLFVVCTWTLDHYWFTLQQNLLLVSILLGLSFRIKQWKKE